VRNWYNRPTSHDTQCLILLTWAEYSEARWETFLSGASTKHDAEAWIQIVSDGVMANMYSTSRSIDNHECMMIIVMMMMIT